MSARPTNRAWAGFVLTALTFTLLVHLLVPDVEPPAALRPDVRPLMPQREPRTHAPPLADPTPARNPPVSTPAPLPSVPAPAPLPPAPHPAPSSPLQSLAAGAAALRTDPAARLAFFHDCLRTAIVASCRPSSTPSTLLSRAEWRTYMGGLLEATAPLRKLDMHNYVYSGPWLEHHWIRAHVPSDLKDLSALEATFYPLVPLLVPWTDGWGTQTWAQEKFRDIFTKSLRSDVLHVTVSQLDRGDPSWSLPCEPFRNLVLLSSGGWGAVSLPLIAQEVGPLPDKVTPRSLVINFQGSMHQGREVLPDIFANSTLPPRLVVVGRGSARDTASHSLLSLAPRGFGRSSFRCYEILQSGRLPVLLTDDVAWTPYQSWQEFAPPGRQQIPQPWSDGPPPRWGVKELGAVVPGPVSNVLGVDVPPPPGGYASAILNEGGVWGPGGVAFVATYAELPALMCLACEWAKPGSAARWRGVRTVSYVGIGVGPGQACPCRAPDWEALVTSLVPPGEKGMVLPPDSLLAEMEARLRVVRDRLFTYAGVVQRVSDFVRSPGDADLLCVAKPDAYGTYKDTGYALHVG